MNTEEKKKLYWVPAKFTSQNLILLRHFLKVLHTPASTFMTVLLFSTCILNETRVSLTLCWNHVVRVQWCFLAAAWTIFFCFIIYFLRQENWINQFPKSCLKHVKIILFTILEQYNTTNVKTMVIIFAIFSPSTEDTIRSFGLNFSLRVNKICTPSKCSYFLKKKKKSTWKAFYLRFWAERMCQNDLNITWISRVLEIFALEYL